MEQVLELALRQSQQAEIYEVRFESTLVHFEANRVKQLESRQSSSVALRIVRDGKLGFASAAGSVDSTRLVQMAVQTSDFGSSVEWSFPGHLSLPTVSTYDERVAAIEAYRLIDIGRGVIDQVRTHDNHIQCEGMVSASSGLVRILNSSGLDTSYPKSSLGLFMEGIRVSGTDMLFVGDSMSSCYLFDEADEVTTTMLKQLDRASRAAHINTGVYPVLFTPHGVGAALQPPLAVAFNGRNVIEKSSRLAGRQGERLFHSGVSLRDDATIDGRVSSAPCDAEGSPSRPVRLIDNGVVSGFLYDLQTAAVAGVESTGSGHRSNARSQVRPGISALVLDSGNATFEEMLSSIDEGLLVEELIGSGQGNLLSGDFGGNVLLGYKVEKGEIVGRVKDTMISGNLMEALGGAVTIGNDSRWVGGSLWTPSLLCRDVSVSTTGGEA